MFSDPATDPYDEQYDPDLPYDAATQRIKRERAAATVAPELTAYLRRWQAVYDMLAAVYDTPPTSVECARVLNLVEDMRP